MQLLCCFVNWKKLSFHMQPFFFGYKFFFSFAYVFVIYTAINRANSSTLRLIMEAHTLGTLIGYYVINIIRNSSLRFIGVKRITITKINYSL
jgi:hypothetical protein